MELAKRYKHINPLELLVDVGLPVGSAYAINGLLDGDFVYQAAIVGAGFMGGIYASAQDFFGRQDRFDRGTYRSVLLGIGTFALAHSTNQAPDFVESVFHYVGGGLIPWVAYNLIKPTSSGDTPKGPEPEDPRPRGIQPSPNAARPNLTPSERGNLYSKIGLSLPADLKKREKESVD